MITLMKYEFKQTYKRFSIYTLLSIAIFLITFIIKIFIGKYNLISLINKPTAFLYMIGINNTINEIPYKDIIIITLTLLLPFIYFIFLTNTAKSFWSDYENDNTIYFYSMPISRIEYWASKVLTHLIYIISYFFIMWIFSFIMLTKDFKNDFQRKILINNINSVFILMITTALLLLAISMLLGSVFDYMYTKNTIKNVYYILIIISIFPNIIKGFYYLISKLSDSAEAQLNIVQKIIDFLNSIRQIIPIYYSNPWVSQNNSTNTPLILFNIFSAIILLIISFIIYSTKDIIKD